MKVRNCASFVSAVAIVFLCSYAVVIAEPTTQMSSASMGTYVGKINDKPAKIELKDNQVAMITASMQDPADSSKMVESKSEGKWVLDGETVTIVMATMDGKPVSDDDAHKKVKFLVDDHGDKLVGNDKMPAELKRVASEIGK